MAGVSKAVLYEHFDTKRELHGELVEARATELFERLQRAAERGETGEARLRDGIGAFLDFVDEHRVEWRGLFSDSGDPEISATLAALDQQVVAVVAGLLAAEPDILGDPDADPAARALMLEAHAQLLVGAIRTLTAWWYDHDGVSAEFVLDRAMEFCWLGMARIGAGERVGGGPGDAS